MSGEAPDPQDCGKRRDHTGNEHHRIADQFARIEFDERIAYRGGQ